MAYYVISSKQVALFTMSVALLVAVCTTAAVLMLEYYHLPEVFLGADGRCLKVVNYKNGDGYTCQDRDVVLRRYRIAS